MWSQIHRSHDQDVQREGKFCPDFRNTNIFTDLILKQIDREYTEDGIKASSILELLTLNFHVV
jgi:hypothetical protein